jgi:xanthine dehydrogenase YagR molybdenum-binding subunit
MAALAGAQVNHSARVTVTGQQMFTVGYRPETLQRVALGANADGGLVSVMHEAVAFLNANVMVREADSW